MMVIVGDIIFTDFVLLANFLDLLLTIAENSDELFLKALLHIFHINIEDTNL